jgi:nucleoside 2-deoxyribosyltransferase
VKIFMICPVRKVTPEFREMVRVQVELREQHGHKVHWPERDTNQAADSIGICEQNRTAIEQADEVHVCYDGESTGCLFDLGVAFALGKRVVAVPECVPPMTEGKSFTNLIWQLHALGLHRRMVAGR